MKILFLTTAPVPTNRETDAHFQELDLLASEFEGKIISTFPLSKPNSLFPRSLHGIHNRKEIKDAANWADIIHVFSPVLHSYRFLRNLGNKPVVYSTLTPTTKNQSIRHISEYVVYDESSLTNILEAGIGSASLSPPYVDFQKNLLPYPEGSFTLMMASAPWEQSQFETKGVNLLLELLGRVPDLQIIFIWRDILFNEINKLVQESPYRNRITLVNGRVNIAEFLSRAHAVVLIAQFSSLVKSFPHSLMEGLLSGRPILTSPTIPMSQVIDSNNYGQSIKKFSIDSLEESVHELMNNYADHCEAIAEMPEDRFGKQAFITFHQKLYDRLLRY